MIIRWDISNYHSTIQAQIIRYLALLIDFITIDPELDVMVTEIRGKRQDSATVLALLCAQDTLEEAGDL